MMEKRCTAQTARTNVNLRILNLSYFAKVRRQNCIMRKWFAYTTNDKLIVHALLRGILLTLQVLTLVGT